jgi:hypothetical protein
MHKFFLEEEINHVSHRKDASHTNQSHAALGLGREEGKKLEHLVTGWSSLVPP